MEGHQLTGIFRRASALARNCPLLTLSVERLLLNSILITGEDDPDTHPSLRVTVAGKPTPCLPSRSSSLRALALSRWPATGWSTAADTGSKSQKQPPAGSDDVLMYSSDKK